MSPFGTSAKARRVRAPNGSSLLAGARDHLLQGVCVLARDGVEGRRVMQQCHARRRRGAPPRSERNERKKGGKKETKKKRKEERGKERRVKPCRTHARFSARRSHEGRKGGAEAHLGRPAASTRARRSMCSPSAAPRSDTQQPRAPHAARAPRRPAHPAAGAVWAAGMQAAAAGSAAASRSLHSSAAHIAHSQIQATDQRTFPDPETANRNACRKPVYRISNDRV
jgi:hypothetical protein